MDWPEVHLRELRNRLRFGVNLRRAWLKRGKMQGSGGHSEGPPYNGIDREFHDQGETMRYVRPHSIEDAVGLLAGSAARPPFSPEAAISW